MTAVTSARADPAMRVAHTSAARKSRAISEASEPPAAGCTDPVPNPDREPLRRPTPAPGRVPAPPGLDATRRPRHAPQHPPFPPPCSLPVSDRHADTLAGVQ